EVGALRRELFNLRQDIEALSHQLDLADREMSEAKRSLDIKDTYVASLRQELEKTEAEYRKLSAAVSSLIPNHSDSATSVSPVGEGAVRAEVASACLKDATQLLRREATWRPLGQGADALPLLVSALVSQNAQAVDSSRESLNAPFAACTIVARNY